MANNKDLTESQFIEVCNSLNINLTGLFGDVKAYIDNTGGASKEELEALIKENNKEFYDKLEVSQGQVDKIKVILDALDGSEDGEFDAKKLLDTILENQIKTDAKLDVTIQDIKECKANLDAETKARVAQGSTLESAIETAKSTFIALAKSFEDKLKSFALRLADLEGRVDSLEDNQGQIFKCLTNIGDTIGDLRATFAIPVKVDDNANAV